MAKPVDFRSAASAGAESPSSEQFSEDYSRSIGALRGALEALLRSAGGEPQRPQELARGFELDKNLTWKVSRLIRTEDPVIALRFLPGPGGLKILDEAVGPKASAEARARLDAALEAFGTMLERHAGDRATLEMMAQGLDHVRAEGEVAGARTLLRARRDAFRGNAAVWGVQAKTQLASIAIAPNAENPEFADVLKVEGLLDFRRTRGDARWLLFSRQGFLEDEERPFPAGGRPLEVPPHGDGGAPLLAEFCSKPLPDITVLEGNNHSRYELPGGAVGNTSLVSCVYAVLVEQVGQIRTPDADAYSEVGASCVTPVEHLQIDLLLHRDLGWNEPPSAQVFGQLDGISPFSKRQRAGRALPLAERVVSLGPGAGALSSAHVPRCAEMIEYAMQRVGWSPEAFSAWRFSMPHPPIPTTALLATLLPRTR